MSGESEVTWLHSRVVELSEGPKWKGSKPTQEELGELHLAYITDHLKYEHDMLAHAFRRVHNTPPGADWNAFYESFCLHARNLAYFFRHKEDLSAQLFAPGHKKAKHNSVFERLNSFLFHQSDRREWKRKPNLHDLQEIGAWIDNEWARFVSGVSPAYKGLIDAAPVCAIADLTLAEGLTLLTACSSVQADTLLSAASTGLISDGIMLTINTDRKGSVGEA